MGAVVRSHVQTELVEGAFQEDDKGLQETFEREVGLVVDLDLAFAMLREHLWRRVLQYVV